MGLPKVSLRDICRWVGVSHLEVTEVLRRVSAEVLAGSEVITQEVGTFRPVDRKARRRVLNGVEHQVAAERVVQLRPNKSVGVPVPAVVASKLFNASEWLKFSGLGPQGGVEPETPVGPFNIAGVFSVPYGVDYVVEGSEYARFSVELVGCEGSIGGVDVTVADYSGSDRVVFDSLKVEVTSFAGAADVAYDLNFTNDGRFPGVNVPGVQMEQLDIVLDS